MAEQIAPISGLIELQDEFTGKLGLAEAALGQFSKNNQESLKATAAAAALVTAAVVAIGVAVVELGIKGSAVNDLQETLVEFSGSAKNAAEVMDGLREGTRGTVTDFNLAKDAAHLLSTGVKLSADEFKTLGDAAFVLANRGLGSVEENLKTVSDALVTGRTRALAMKLGVVENDKAEEQYAARLGITADQLSDRGKMEAKREEILRMLNETAKSSISIEDDFADKLDQGKATLANWIDKLASAVDSSKVFGAGLDFVGKAFSEAFNDEKGEAIAGILSWVENLAITVIDFVQITISMVKVVETAWYGVKTIVLAVTTAVVAAVDVLMEAVTGAAIVSEKLGLISPETLNSIKETRDLLRGMTVSLTEQTVEAATAIVTHTELDETLDRMNASLEGLQVSMSAASLETEKLGSDQEIATNNAAKLAKTQEELNAAMIDQTKVSLVLQKSTAELAAIYADYNKVLLVSSGTTRDAQIADINAVFASAVAGLDKLDPLYRQKYEAYEKIAKASLNNISNDWASVKDLSLQGMQEQADKALATYQMMTTSGLSFTREVMDEQLKKWRGLQDAANGWGSEAKEAVQGVVDVIKILDRAWITDADIAAATISRTTVMVRTLAGELISLAEAQRRQSSGGSFDVTSANFEKALRDTITNYGWNPNATGVNQYRDPRILAKAGYSFEEVIRYAYDPNNQGPLPPPQGPRIPGFAAGGMAGLARVGENGPEIVRLPIGAQVFPTGTGPGGGVNVVNNFYVNGTGADVARQVSNIIMRELKQTRQFGSA